MGEGRLSGDESPVNQRLTVPEAAARLGITEAAVRGRIKRRTLRSYRESRTVYVLLGGDKPASNRDESTSEPGGKPTDQSELVAALREALDAEREANRENRRIIAALTSRIPQLEAGQTGEDAAQDAAPVQQGQDTPTTQQADTRPWWRRVFGG
jgi:hypothetical protein